MSSQRVWTGSENRAGATEFPFLLASVLSPGPPPETTPTTSCCNGFKALPKIEGLYIEVKISQRAWLRFVCVYRVTGSE